MKGHLNEAYMLEGRFFEKSGFFTSGSEDSKVMIWDVQNPDRTWSHDLSGSKSETEVIPQFIEVGKNQKGQNLVFINS